MKNSTLNYVLRRVLSFLAIAVIIMLFNACQVHAARVEGCLDSGDSLRGVAKIGTNYVGSGYYEWNPQTWNNQNLNVTFCTDLKDHYTQTGKQLINFTIDYCVNGSKPDFAIYSSYYNDIDFTYYLGTSIYLAEGEWSKAYCYRSFIKLRLNYADNVGTGTGGYSSYTQFTQDNNVFAMYGFDNYNKLLRYNDLIYYNPSEYNAAMEEAKRYAQNNTIIEGQQDIIDNQNDNTQDIIDNQNDNTQDIIDNQNDNTQDIIDNQNQNTQDTINSQMVCNYIDKSNIMEERKYLTSSGNVTSTSYNRGITDYISLTKNDKLELLTQNDNVQYYYICFYNVNKTLISCSSTSSMNLGLVDIPNDTSFFRSTINANENKPTFNLCRNGNQALVDSLTDDSNPSLDALNNSAGWLPPGPVDSILNLPIALLNNLTTNLSKSCQPVILPIPYINQNITLPCIYSLYEQMGITTWVGLVGTIASALILFSYLAKLYKWVDDTLTFRENNHIDNWGGI